MDGAPTQAAASFDDQPRSELIEQTIKTENATDSPPLAAGYLVPPPFKSSPTPLPSTETGDAAPMPARALHPKKKGTASMIKKSPKRPRNGGPGKKTKKAQSERAAGGKDEASEDEESDNGPYCLCRGPDDHRWMICCENCEDWFHGECIRMNKEVGENLIEKFICPTCTKGDLTTIYKKTCALGACRKPARLKQSQPSVFCSNEHAQTWWERMVGRLPKGQAKAGVSDQLSQEEFMALLNSDLGGTGEDGTWKLAKTPFSAALPKAIGDEGADDALAHILSDEEKTFLDNAANARLQLAEETLLCRKMLTLVELAQERRRVAIAAGRFGEDMCGYDDRLDTVSARDAFAAYARSPEGEAAFRESKLGDSLGEDDAARGMCERKRCKVHSGWLKMLPLGVKYLVREMANQAAEVAQEEGIVREAAGERWKRKQAEHNWVEVVDSAKKAAASIIFDTTTTAFVAARARPDPFPAIAKRTIAAMSSPRDDVDVPEDLDENEMLAADDAAEEIVADDADDVAMDSDNEDGELELILHNDSIAYFDQPRDSLFAIAQHPVHASLIAVGGSAGPDDDAPGAGWLFDTSAAQSRPVLPPSYASDAAAAAEAPRSTPLRSLVELDGHSDSINALAWTLPRGEVLVSGGLDGRMRAWTADVRPGPAGVTATLLGEAREVDEINWLAPCPSPANPNAVALGASDGSVWVYTMDPSDATNPCQIVQSYFLHTASCTAGAWTSDGQLLATVGEDSSLYVWDVWGLAAAQGLVADNGMTALSLTAEDQRFEVEGGLYSIAIDPKDAFVVAGGAGGAVKVVSLPRLAPATQSQSDQSRARGGRAGAGKSSSADHASAGGQILASLHTQGDSVESLAVSLAPTTPPTTLLAAGSVDGSIVVYDASRRFAVRRHIPGAHDGHSVVRLDFVPASWLLTSCGMDGVVRRWDLRASGSSTAAGPGGDAGLLREWRGHRGDGAGGVLGFVQGQTGERLVTAGDDGLALVFEA
ncbi:Set1 complex component spp1 [Tolypocladium capitatum]|uniref:Set1 complex component spp1 n=1 Tax=Tolypocladium capitatum TaxID=45235 RepID=A0A2K3Q667_9HYPO|nr:Set1 complex component spp1 [Tolypocladium capitatum]